MSSLPSLLYRRSFSLTSFFYHPDLGMKHGYEVLSSASCCLVRWGGGGGALPSPSPFSSSSSSFSRVLGASTGIPPPRYHVLTSQHVTHPWRYPSYYSPEAYPFVHMLGEEHVRVQLELRDAAGEVLVRAPLRPVSFPHPQRDLSVFHMQNEAAFEKEAQEAGYGVEACELEEELARPTSSLLFDGHELLKPSQYRGEKSPPAVLPHADAEGGDVDVLIPQRISGRLLERSTVQVFAKTARDLPMGMCGGPVLHAHGAPGNRCVGIVEGIVPSSAAAAIAGSTAGNKSDDAESIVGNQADDAVSTAGKQADNEVASVAASRSSDASASTTLRSAEQRASQPGGSGSNSSSSSSGHVRSLLAGTAVFVESRDILKFTRFIEARNGGGD